MNDDRNWNFESQRRMRSESNNANASSSNPYQFQSNSQSASYSGGNGGMRWSEITFGMFVHFLALLVLKIIIALTAYMSIHFVGDAVSTYMAGNHEDAGTSLIEGFIAFGFAAPTFYAHQWLKYFSNPFFSSIVPLPKRILRNMLTLAGLLVFPLIPPAVIYLPGYVKENYLFKVPKPLGVQRLLAGGKDRETSEYYADTINAYYKANITDEKQTLEFPKLLQIDGNLASVNISAPYRIWLWYGKASNCVLRVDDGVVQVDGLVTNSRFYAKDIIVKGNISGGEICATGSVRIQGTVANCKVTWKGGEHTFSGAESFSKVTGIEYERERTK